MRILVFGAGAVGSLLGGMLARTGHEVWLLGRAAHLDAIEKNGLEISGIWGNYRTKALELASSAEEIKSKNLSFDLILFTVKSYDTKSAIAQAASFMSDSTTLLSFQNGLGNIEAILEKIKPEQFLAGRIITGVEMEPGKIKVTVSADDLVIGSLPNLRAIYSADKAVQLFNMAKVKARAVPDIFTYIWAKVIYNCALNGICAIHGIPYGKILDNPETKRKMEEVVRECYAVALKKGIVLDPPDAESYLKLLIGKLIPLTATHYPSMLQDIQKAKRVEIEALNGAIAKLGRELGVPTPANQNITDQINKKSSVK